MNLSIVPFTKAHLPQVVRLFLLSLGDEGGVPTPEYWQWKHIDNPFGTSPTLLMVDGQRVVGIRAFMAWDWYKDGRVYHSYRCVDTATHPDYRGKGIFKKLTLAMLDELGPDRADFIFNTPNELSKPGYLKMGWEVAGKVPLYLRPVIGGMLHKKFSIDGSQSSRDIPVAKLTSLTEQYTALTSSFLSTRYMPAYFQWRYDEIPDIEYYSYGLNDKVPNALCYYRLKHTGRIRELRVTDLIYANHEQLNALLAQLPGLARRSGATAISLLKPAGVTALMLARNGFLPFPPQAMVLTKRRVGSEPIFDNLEPKGHWNISSGAIELF